MTRRITSALMITSNEIPSDECGATLIPAQPPPADLAHRLPPGYQRGAGKFLSAQVELVDLARVGDVIQRVGVEHQKVCALAGRDLARLVEPQDSVPGAFRGDHGLHR